MHWLLTTPHGASTTINSSNATSPTTSNAGDAIADVVPIVLAMLDFASLQQLSSVSRSAAHSHIRIHVLQRSSVQLTSDSHHVHDMLRHMPLRDFLFGAELRNCWALPYGLRDLQQLLASIQRVTFASELTLDRDVHDQVHALQDTKETRMMSHDGFTRRVRRRLALESASSYALDLRDSLHVVDHMQMWLAAAPVSLVEIDFGDLKIDHLRWLRHSFPSLRKLTFDCSTSEPLDREFLEPLAEAQCAQTLRELVIVELQVNDGSALSALIELRSLELRGANRLRDLAFLRKLPKLESLFLSDLRITDLSPLTSLTTLNDLVLDSIGRLTPVAIHTESHPSVAEPTWPQLQTLQIHFTYAPTAWMLAQSPRLVTLHLCETKLRDWTPLAAMQYLESVSLNVDGVTDWSPLARLPRLKELTIDSKFGITRSSHFAGGHGRWLALEQVVSPPWDDYTPLVESAPSLERLQLLGWRSRDSSSLETLRHATKLEMLRIAFVPGAVDLSSLSELRQLRRLDLWSVSVVSIGFLRELVNLQELTMPSPYGAAASITDFSPLSKLTNLKTLVLSGRPELKNAHMAIVTELPKLKNVDVGGSGVTITTLKKLRRRYNTESYKTSPTRAVPPSMRMV